MIQGLALLNGFVEVAGSVFAPVQVHCPQGKTCLFSGFFWEILDLFAGSANPLDLLQSKLVNCLKPFPGMTCGRFLRLKGVSHTE
jgi:hypothetical protein